jgi:hypothetical protein
MQQLDVHKPSSLHRSRIQQKERRLDRQPQTNGRQRRGLDLIKSQVELANIDLLPDPSSSNRLVA